MIVALDSSGLMPFSVVPAVTGPRRVPAGGSGTRPRLIEMDYHIKLNLIIDEQDHDKCIKVFKSLSVVSASRVL